MKHTLVRTLLGLLCCLVAGSATAAFKAFIANQNSTTVAVVDLNPTSVTYETQIATIDTGGSDTYWVAASANGRIVAVSKRGDDSVAIIDATTNTLLGVVGSLGSEIEAIAVNSSGSTVYAAGESDDTLWVINVATLSVAAGPIDLNPGPPACSEPENMVISPDDAFLYVTCAGSEVIRVATAGFALLQIATGLTDPHGIALSPDGSTLYYTDGTNGIAWNTGTMAPTGTTFTGCDMYGGAVSADGTRLYCVEEGTDVLIYPTGGAGATAPTATIALGSGSARAVAEAPGPAGPAGPRIYIPTSGGDAAEVVDPIGLTNLAGNVTLNAGADLFFDPRGIAIANSPDGIPTLTEWGLMGLLLLLAVLGMAQLKQRFVPAVS